MNIPNAMPMIQSLAGEGQISGVEKAMDPARPSPVSQGSDDAQLSGAASLASKTASLPDVRSEKVEAVKAAIADGSYHVSSSDVAGAMVNQLVGKS